MKIPLLDSLIVKIEKKIDHDSISVFSGLAIIPSKMVSLVYKNGNWKQKFNLFADVSKDDFPFSKGLKLEMDSGQTCSIESEDFLPHNISNTLKCIEFNSSKNIIACLRIFGTTPLHFT